MRVLTHLNTFEPPNHCLFVVEIIETPEKSSGESTSENNNSSTPSKSFVPTHPSVRTGIAEKLAKGKTAATAHRLVLEILITNYFSSKTFSLCFLHVKNSFLKNIACVGICHLCMIEGMYINISYIVLCMFD